jgi:hypothetical protein
MRTEGLVLVDPQYPISIAVWQDALHGIRVFRAAPTTKAFMGHGVDQIGELAGDCSCAIRGSLIDSYNQFVGNVAQFGQNARKFPFGVNGKDQKRKAHSDVQDCRHAAEVYWIAGSP